MSSFEMKLPDVGEGVAEAELVAWLVEVGDAVTPETTLAEVLTDKATIEISSPVTGIVTARYGAPGDVLAVGSGLVAIETSDGADPEVAAPAVPVAQPATPAAAPASRATASPAVRARSRDLGIDLADIRGSGPDGRIVHADLDRVLAAGGVAARPVAPLSDATHAEPVRGVRRRIAERLSTAWSEIPHITYVEAIDATELERLRAELNRRGEDHGVRLTILPFLVRALVIAGTEQPRLNAHYDQATETVTTFDAVHVGIAAQTDGGLLVPVVRHAESRRLWDLASEIARVTAAARDGRANREELSGSTITVTSLGALGGLATTPIINRPEVAIVGVNKMETRPVWRHGAFEPRQMFNLSSSFDHRIVDGWDAATFIQRVRSLLETPALLFVDD